MISRLSQLEPDIDFALDRLGNGIECTVFDVGDDICYKQYPNPNDAKFSFQCQQIGFENGIAPEVIGLLKTGYFSKKAIPFSKLRFDDRTCWNELCERGYVDLLCDKIDQIFGTGFCDNHSGNIALSTEGDICLIDFGYESFGRTTAGASIQNEIDNEEKNENQMCCNKS